jgi:hypothetical protein
VVTVKGVSSRSEYVHLRVEPEERKRWQEAARASGRSLSQMIRDGIEVELERCDHGGGEGGIAASAAPHTQPARATGSVAPTLEERLRRAASGGAPVIRT